MSSSKLRSNNAEDSVISKLVDLAFGTFISWARFKALVAGNEGNIRQESIEVVVILFLLNGDVSGKTRL
jgi:hypothetical protein